MWGWMEAFRRGSRRDAPWDAKGAEGGPRGEGGWVGAVGAVGRGVGEPTWSSRRSSRLLWMLLPGWAICARTL